MKKGEITREKILQCAEKAFSEKGYYPTQVSDIVDLAHVAKGTIYQYFKNKEDLYLTLLESYATAWEEAIALDITQYIGDQPGIFYAKEYLKHRIYKTAIYFGENPQRSKIILRISIGVNEVIEKVNKFFERRVLTILTGDINLGKQAGNIPEEINVEIASNAILGGVLRLSYFYYVERKITFEQMQKSGMLDEMVIMVQNVLKMY